MARERDLCDVKVKVTEYLAGATREDVLGHLSMQPGREGDAAEKIDRVLQPAGGWQPPLEPGEQRIELGPDGGLMRPFYTVQRVNASATGGEGDAERDDAAGRHRHGLDESDRVKKNSVVRATLKSEKEMRKAGGPVQQVFIFFPLSRSNLCCSPCVDRERLRGIVHLVIRVSCGSDFELNILKHQRNSVSLCSIAGSVEFAGLTRFLFGTYTLRPPLRS